MKKFIIGVMSLGIGVVDCMYYDGPKLQHDEITLINKSALALKISWLESTREGKNHELFKEIAPQETVVIKLGEFGGFRRDYRAKSDMDPTRFNPSLTENFLIEDLPSSKTYAFTAVTLADIMKDILVPGMFSEDNKGNLNKFQYLNIQDVNKIFQKLYEVKSIQ